MTENDKKIYIVKMLAEYADKYGLKALMELVMQAIDRSKRDN